MNIHEYLNKLIAKKDLSEKQAEELVDLITSSETDPILIASILTALRVKGETVGEISGFIKGMRKKMVSVTAPKGAIDIVGTGGDGKHTFNISTAAALVTAAAGVPVAKHGNRAASSKCGSADVLEELGVHLGLTGNQAETVLKKVGMVFLFAPLFHPAMKSVVPVRKVLKTRTIFNYLGPFLNPAGVKRIMLGVPDTDTAKLFVEIAKKLGYEYCLIVTNADGVDEISLSNKTHAYEIKGSRVKAFIIDLKDYGFKRMHLNHIVGGDAKENAAIIEKIFSGEKGVKRDTVVLNSAFALHIAGTVKTIKQGIILAQETIDGGKANAVLEGLKKESRRFS